MLMAISGCSRFNVAPEAYEAEQFNRLSPYQFHLPVDSEAACLLSQRVLLSQGYLLDETKKLSFSGTKFFQQDTDNQTRLKITLTCLSEASGSAIYAVALQSRYELKTTSKNTGLSVAGVGSITLPWDEGKESLVKISDETVTDPEFYSRLFNLLNSYLPANSSETRVD